MRCKSRTVLHMLWNAKHLVGGEWLSIFCSNVRSDFPILINSFITTPRYWQICVRYMFTRSTSSPHHDEVTTDPVLLNIKNAIFYLISNIILPKVLSLLYPVQHEKLAVIYWNLYVVPKYHIEKWIDVSELNKLTCSIVGWHTCNTTLFHSECASINSVVATLFSALFFDNKHFTF